MKKILFVTSFNRRIYELSGVRFLYTFLYYKINVDLLITYEGENEFLNNLIKKYTKIKLYNLNNYDYLNNWLKENENYICEKYGGKYKIYQFDNDTDIKLLNSFNQRTPLWFRKIASFKYTLDNYKNDYENIVWIDADTFYNGFDYLN